MADILIIDDDHVLCKMLGDQLRKDGHSPVIANTLQDGVELIKNRPIDLVLLDVQLPDGNGLEYLPKFTGASSKPEVIIITGHGEADGAEKAIMSGAWSYIEKPYVIRDLPLHLSRALQYRLEKKRVKQVPVALKRKHIIGDSSKLNSCLDQLASAAMCDVSVLLTGETGTGKELFAKAVHDNSARMKHNFVIVDCAALPENLIESTLFGHVKGAFTGADRAQDGLIKHAHKGTLFLDEVGELSLSVQKNFLRVLQEREFRPVGASKHQQSDFRLVAATNKNLKEMVARGEFREDLLFRLQALNIELPSLRERKEDIRDLVTHILANLCERYGRETKGVAPDFIEALSAYNWPGNVRELHQTIEQVFADATLGPTCFTIHLPRSFRVLQARAGFDSAQDRQKVVSKETLPSWRTYKDSFEKQYMENLVATSQGDAKTACNISSLSKTRLYQLLNKYELKLN